MRRREPRRDRRARASCPTARPERPQHDCDPRADPREGTPRLSAPFRDAIYGTEGPIQAEVFVLRLEHGTPRLAGPCGPAAWYIEVGSEDDPMDVVRRLATDLIGAPLVVHSTSWRRDRGTVLLSFLVIIRDDQGPQYQSVPIARAVLARGTATDAPSGVQAEQVIEHGLRHLSWLAKDDPAVDEALTPAWRDLLSGYVPEPFRHLA